MLAPSSARVLTCPRTQKWPQSTQNFELTSLLLTNVQTCSMVAWLRVLSRRNLSYPSRRSSLTKGCKKPVTAALTTFRINTCKSVSKQTTLTFFRINTYEKPGGRGAPASCDFLVYPDLRAATRLPRSSRGHFRRHMRLMHPEWIYGMRPVTPLSPVPSSDSAYFPSPRGWHPFTPAVSPLRQLRSLRLFTPSASSGLPRASRGPLSFAFSCRAFVFTKIQIPFPGTPLFSHPCKTPGGC